MIDALSDGQEAEAEHEAAKRKADELDDGMRAMAATKAARAVIYEILCEFGAFDAVYSARAAGRQECGIQLILRLKRADIGLYHTMLQENEK